MAGRVRGFARSHPNLTAAALILVVTGAFFWPVVAQGKDFSTIAGHQETIFPWRSVDTESLPVQAAIQSDQAALSYPWQVELNRRVDEGTLPFWNRSTFLGGYPMFSNGNAAHLYPPHLVPAVLGVSAQAAHHLFSALHLFLSGFFCYLFLRELGRSWWASIFGGFAWMLSSYNMAWLHFEVVAPLQALLPAALFLVARAHHRRSVASTVAAGGVFALMMISGHVLWMGISAIVAGGYAVALAVERHVVDDDAESSGLIGRKRGRHEQRRPRWSAWLAALRQPATMALVAAGLSAVVLIPTAHTLSQAQREAFSYAEIYATQTSLGGRQLSPPTVLYRLFVPWGESVTPGTINTHLAFAGTATGILALVGLVTRRVRGVGFGRVTFGFFALAAIGGPVTWIAYHLVPVFRVFRPYGRFFQWATLGLVVLAAVGFDRVRQAYVRRVAARPLPHILRPHMLAGLVVVLTVGQLLVVGRGLNPTFPDSDASLRFPSTGLIDALEERRDADPWPARTLPVSDPASGAFVFSVGNQNLVFDLDLVGGYDSVLPGRNFRLLRYLSGADADSHSAEAFYVIFDKETSRFGLLPRLGIGGLAVVPDLDIADPWGGVERRALDVEERYVGDDGTLVVLTDDVGPHVVGDVTAVDDDDEAFDTFVDEDFDWERTVVLEPGAWNDLADADLLPDRSVDADVEVIDWGANTLALRVDTSGEGLLVIPATWDAGWSATVDGVDVPVVRGNYYQQVVPVGPGQSVVELRYRPEGLILGGGVSAATAVAVGGAVIAERVGRRRRREKVRRPGRTDGLEDELIGEHRGPDPDTEAFDPGDHPVS